METEHFFRIHQRTNFCTGQLIVLRVGRCKSIFFTEEKSFPSFCRGINRCLAELTGLEELCAEVRWSLSLKVKKLGSGVQRWQSKCFNSAGCETG